MIGRWVKITQGKYAGEVGKIVRKTDAGYHVIYIFKPNGTSMWLMYSIPDDVIAPEELNNEPIETVKLYFAL